MRQMCDVNILLALVAQRHAHHERCKCWWRSRDHSSPLLICREVQIALLRLLATEAVMAKETLTLPRAWALYAALLKCGGFRTVREPRGIDVAWERVCRPYKRSPKVVMNAYLAAFAMAGGYTLVTLDTAFRNFDGLSLVIPE